MKLHPPFIIGARLLPALRVGAAFLSFEETVGVTPDNRDTAVFYVDLPDGRTFRDCSLQSGCGGFRNPVEAFESFLCFAEHAAESDDGGELFAAPLLEWIRDNAGEVSATRCDISDESGNPKNELIEV